MRSIKISDESYKALREESKEQGVFMWKLIDRAVAIFLLQRLKVQVQEEVGKKKRRP